MPPSKLPTYENLLDKHLAELQAAHRILVGFSGGLDSTLLLAAALSVLPSKKIVAVHVNHGLNNDADAWQVHCQSQAERLGCGFVSHQVSIENTTGIEERARERRYQVFASTIQQDDILLLGHHADDQVETLLFRLFRGSGLRGLSGIPERRSLGQGKILRPFLRFDKQTLKEIATNNNLSWIEDSSNNNTQFDRNFIRQQLLPLICSRFPKSDEQILHAADIFRETEALLSDIAEDDLRQCDHRKEGVGESISIALIAPLDSARQTNLLRRLLFRSSGYVPNQQQLLTLKADVLGAQQDAQPVLRFKDRYLRRFQNRLYITPHVPTVEELDRTTIFWPAEQSTVEIPGLWRITKIPTGEALEIRFRSGGERLKPVGRDHSQTLKKLVQEFHIEPWLRDIVPVVYNQDEIIAFGDHIICSNILFHLQWLIEPS